MLLQFSPYRTCHTGIMFIESQHFHRAGEKFSQGSGIFGRSRALVNTVPELTQNEGRKQNRTVPGDRLLESPCY